MPEPAPKLDIHSKFLDVFTQEQIEMLADLFKRVRDRAIDRHSHQTVEIIFDEKGHPRHFNGSDNVNAPKPRIYQSE